VRQADYEQAKRELTGGPDMDRQEAVLESLPEGKRWDPVPGSTGRQAPESPSETRMTRGERKPSSWSMKEPRKPSVIRMFQAARAAEKTDQREP